MYLSKDNNIIISPQIDSWAKENYPEEFLKLNNYILSLPNITDKRFKRSTEINIRRIKGNFFDAYNLMVSHNLDKELLFNEIEQNANAETVYDLTGNSSCFGFTPILYSPLGYKDLPLVMSARHIYLCTNPFGFYSDNLAHYHNLDISVLEDIPNNLNNVIFMYQGKRQTESIVSVLDYDIPIKDELGNITTNKTKLQLIIKPKPIGIKTFFSNLPIESNILATAFEFDSINNEHILYVNKNKKSLAQQLISHSIPDGRDRTEVVSNSGFYKKNIKYYIESVNKNLKLKESFLYNEDFIDRINLEIENTDNPDVEDIIRNINKNFLRASQIPENIHTISDSVLSFENKQTDILDIIGKKYEIDATGKPTIKGMKALSRAMEIYSDKHFETARYLFVKDGTIVRHITISSHTPASTIIKPDDNFLYQLKSYAEETGSQIVFLHNHPSGYVVPSEADIELTEYINNFLTNPNGKSYFAGHIILDHGSFGFYDSAEHKWKALVEDKLYPIEEVKKHYKIQLSKHGKKVDFDIFDNISASSLKELSDYARKCDAGNVWNTKDWIPGFLITGNGIVTSLEHFNLLDFQNENILSERLKTIGRNYGSENIVLFPQNREQFMLCERFAQDTGKIKEVFLRNEDGTFEVSQYKNGNIFNDLKIDEIKIEDTLEETEAVKNKILYEQNVNKDININVKEKTTMAKKIKKSEQDITDLKKDFIEKIKAEMNDMESPEMSYYDFGNLVNKITSNNYSEKQKDLLNKIILDMSETDDIEMGIKYLQNRIETDIAIENGAAWEFNEKNEKVLKTSEPYTQQDKENSLSNNEKNIQKEEQKINYVLDKLAAAGVEVVTDKDKYQSMLSYVQEVNISLDMINQNNINSQNLSENDKDNLLLNLSEISKECQENVLSPNEFISKLTDIFGSNSKYLNQNLNESSCSFRISVHSSRNPDNNNLILKFSNINLSEFEYKPENLNLEKMQGIIDGLQNWLKTGEYTDKNYDNNYESTKEELQANLAEQLTLGGFKKTLLTGIALASMAAVGPKLYADTHLSKLDKDENGKVTKVTVETQLQVQDVGDGYTAIINKNNKDKFNDVVVIIDENGRPTISYSYNDYMKEFNLPKGESYTKSFTYTMDSSAFLNMMNDWKLKGYLYNYGQGHIITDNDDRADYVDLINGWIDGGNYSNAAEFFINDSITYGFALNNKIYLNPDVINSEVAVHEYTHIWDKYTQNTNPELWQKGKDILRNTKYWNEIKSDPNYANIADNDDLLLSEVHSRICGKMADKVLSRIAEQDGKLTQETVIDWDKETWNYICEEMMEGQAVNYENGLTSKDLSDFLAMPVKDLMQGHNITQQLDLSHEHDFNISEQNNSKSSISEYNDLGIDTRTGEPWNNTEDIESDFEINDSIDNNINFEEATDLDNTRKLNTPSSENELQNIINNLRQQLEQLNESFRLQVEENNKLRADIEMFKQNIAANKDVTANDSRSAINYSSPANSETGNFHEILYNKDGFGRDTAYKVNTVVPKFGHEDENGTLHIIKNARFAKLIVNEENIGQNTVILDITKEDGSHEEFKLPEKDYNDIINYEQELQSRIRETPDDSFAWMKAHMDYAQKMRIDENMYRLNTPENFIHNFRIHCRKDQAHNPNDALKIAGIMYDKMEPFDKERFLKMRRDWDKKMGKGSFDRNLIKEFNEYHPKNDIDISKVSQEQFSEEKAFNEMNPIISVLKPGDIIEGTHACVGDTFNFSMKLKSPDGSIIEEPKTDWKIARVCKNLYTESAVIFNEESKSYYTIPLDKLKEKIIFIEKQQKKEQNKQFKKSNNLVQRQESNEIIRQEQKAVNKEIKKSRKNDRMVADSYGQ